MEIAGLGEEDLIRRFATLLDSSKTSRVDVLIGIGDDAALVRDASSGAYQLLTTDQTIEGVHFQRDWGSPQDLGWKSLAINLSDIAAMGGTPTTALVSLSLPSTTEVEWIESFYKGLAHASATFNVPIVGGDVSSGPVIAIAVTVLGTPPLDPYGQPISLRRSQANVGDLVAVTGTLGGPAAGLRAFQSGSSYHSLAEAFLHPVPRLAEARLLVEEGVHTAIDISDGLIGDLQRLCLASSLAAEIETVHLPVHPDAQTCYPQQALTMALAGGEDYELLFTAPEGVVERVQARSEVPITAIGRIVEGDAGLVRALDEQGRELPVEKIGWRHFE